MADKIQQPRIQVYKITNKGFVEKASKRGRQSSILSCLSDELSLCRWEIKGNSNPIHLLTEE